jgi:hypothetical protein
VTAAKTKREPRVPECEVCSEPRPIARDRWLPYQRAILTHLLELPSIGEVRDHETARRRFLGEDGVELDNGVRAALEWWETATRLRELLDGKPDPYENLEVGRVAASGRWVPRWAISDPDHASVWTPEEAKA